MITELQSDKLRVKILAKGAELCSVTDLNGTEFIWQAKPETWPRHAPLLFPVVGRLRNNMYTFDGATYPMSQHGFAREMVFELTEKKETSCTYLLYSNAATKKNFPFDFVLKTNYCLYANELVTSYTVSNPSAAFPLLFSIGAHPGFNCPIAPGESFEDYYLEFEKNKYDVTLLNEGLRQNKKHSLQLNDKKLFLQQKLFDNDAMVFENSQIHQISLYSFVSGRGLSLSCSGWPAFGIWSKKGCRQFICLEPWYGIADSEQGNADFSSKKEVIALDPEKEFQCAFTIKFH